MPVYLHQKLSFNLPYGALRAYVLNHVTLRSGRKCTCRVIPDQDPVRRFGQNNLRPFRISSVVTTV
eukprot:6194407-Pleurochrysis_carterae.AAC.1